MRDLLVHRRSHGNGEFKHFGWEGRGLELNSHMAVPVMVASITDQRAIENTQSVEFRVHQTCVM